MTRKTREEMKIIARQQLEERNLVAEQAARIAELEAALAEPCRYHHLPLINGWAHKIDNMGHPKTVRCTLSEKARALLKGGAS